MIRPFEPSAPWQGNQVVGDSYDIVVIGGGLHALALAYFLSTSYSITNVAVLARGSIFGQSTAAPIAALEPRPWSAAGAELTLRTGSMYRSLGSAVGDRRMIEDFDQLVLARTAEELAVGRWRTELSKSHGASAETIDAERARKLLPTVPHDQRLDVVGGQLSAGAGVLRTDLAADAFARGAFDAGVRLFEGMPVAGMDVAGGRVRGVRTADTTIRTPIVVICAPGWASIAGDMAGVQLPLTTRRHEAMLTEPTPLHLPLIVRGEGDCVVIAPSEDGAMLVSGVCSEFGTYSSTPSYGAIDRLASGAVRLFPALERARLAHHWSELSDTTTDGQPIVGPTAIEGLLCNAGWGLFGASLSAGVACELASSIAENSLSPLLEAFGPTRLESTVRAAAVR